MFGFVKIVCLLYLTTVIVACGEPAKSRKYKDLTSLEQPPDIVKQDVKTKGLKSTSAAIKKGLGDHVNLKQVQDKQVLLIDKSFSKSWRLMRKALKHNKIKVVDTNRSQGAFFVTYDADDHIGENKKPDILSRVAGLFDNQYNEQDFLLTVESKGEHTRVSAKVVDTNDKLDDEEKADFDDAGDAGDKLMTDLYITLRDELPDL